MAHIVQLSIFTAIVPEKCIPGAVLEIMGLFVGELVSTQPMGYMGKVCERE
jgi:hypothetical protein